MAWNTPITWDVDQIVTNTNLNEQIRDNLTYLKAAWDGYILLEDQKAQGTDGGTFTAGAWQTRDLNTEVADVGEHASLSSNQFTLDAGTYEAWWRAPGYRVNGHQTRLQNVTDGTTIKEGSTSAAEFEDSSAGGLVIQTDSVGQCRFTIASSKTFEIQHRCSVTRATTGFGKSQNWSTEVYGQVWLRKVV